MIDDRVPEQLENLVLYAWVGPKDDPHAQDDHWGIKIGVVPAGTIPLVAIDRTKVEKVWPQMKGLARGTGKVRYLARFEFAGVVRVEKP
jgi:hypothetical protein